VARRFCHTISDLLTVAGWLCGAVELVEYSTRLPPLPQYSHMPLPQ